MRIIKAYGLAVLCSMGLTHSWNVWREAKKCQAEYLASLDARR